MTARKIKHARAVAKRESFMRELAESGLEAQRADHHRRKVKELEAWQDQHDKKHSWKKRIKECPHCQLEIKASERAQNTTEPEEDVAEDFLNKILEGSI